MLRNLTVGKKIYMGFATVLLLLIVVAGVGWYSIHNIRDSLGDLTGHHIPLLQAGANLETSVYQQQLAVSQYALHKDRKYLDQFNATDKEADAAFAKAVTVIKDDEDLVARGWLKQIETIAQKHDELLVSPSKEFLAAVTAGKPAEEIDHLADSVEAGTQKLKELIDSFIATNNEEADRVAAEAREAGDTGRLGMVLTGGIALLVGCMLAFLIGRGITGPVRRIIAGLIQGSEQLASAAGQVSSASQSLAEGSSEQAASLEETSSSLEEITSMVKQNSDNANQANQLAQETNAVMDRANQAMADLTRAMDEISAAGEQTAKIIKTIDEIAFQTNLLALNAAVEAARAGEAGAGFAVVAEEVRNLAMRAAEAAKNTAGLIEGTIKKTKEGAELVVRTNQAFSEVRGSANKVGELVGEIAAASAEQSQGIGQINVAMSQMDKVTQQVAANAEESASASEELSAQSETLRGVVGELEVLVEGGNHQEIRQIRLPKPARSSKKTGGVKSLPGPSSQKDKGGKAAAAIPLEDDFRDF